MMMSSAGPTRQSDSLADVVELVLDKGVVINADIAVSIGDTKLLGIQLRAALASFDTAAKYGLEFPEGTDMQRVAAAAGVDEIPANETQANEIDEADTPTVQTAISQVNEGGIELDTEDSPDSESDTDKQSTSEQIQQSTKSSESDSESDPDEGDDDTD